MLNQKTIEKIIDIAREAGKKIMEVYNGPDFELQFKEDNSPLTTADRASHDVIEKGLSTFGGENKYPLLSEEGSEVFYEERKCWDAYWLIDPLDGTKEFVKRNGEFTVNIALVKAGRPVFGVVFAPVLDICYYGGEGIGAWKVENGERKKIETPEGIGDILYVVASRSHMSDETRKYIDLYKTQYSSIETVSKGSSLKLCMVADGQAMLYPRLAPTMEWDTAAADAVCRAAGCHVIQYATEKPLQYNKENLLNPWFIVKGKGL